MARRIGIFVLAWVCLSAPAWGQATQPAVAANAATATPAVATDAYADVPLPVRGGGSPAGAATQAAGVRAKASAPADALDTKRIAIAMAVVLGAIFAAHQVWRRLGMPGAGVKNPGALQVVSRMAVGPKQQLMLVRVGRRCVLVGNSGAQMNALCEIGDPDEVGVLLGQTASVSEREPASSFDTVLGGESRRFEESIDSDLAAHEAHAAEEARALSATRDELSGMMEKVRGLSRQFSAGGAKGQ